MNSLMELEEQYISHIERWNSAASGRTVTDADKDGSLLMVDSLRALSLYNLPVFKRVQVMEVA